MGEQKKEFIDLNAITERLLIVFNKFGGTAKEFTDLAQISASRFSEVKNGKSTIRVAEVNAVIRNCSDFMDSPKWFVFGAEDLQPESNLFSINSKEERFEENNHLLKRLEESFEKNAALKARNDQLEAEVKALRSKEQCSLKEITEIKVYYKNNSFETYLLETIKDEDY